MELHRRTVAVSSIQLNGTGPTSAVDLAKIATTSPAAAQHAADTFKPVPMAPEANLPPTMKDVAG